MREYFFERIAEISGRKKPDYVADFEAQAERFILNLAPGIFERLLETKDNSLRIYHSGAEIKVVPGFPAKDVLTGKEEVFVEFLYGDGAYHLVGNVEVDHPVSKFKFKRIERYKNKGYSRVSIDKHKGALLYATDILRQTQPPEFPVTQ